MVKRNFIVLLATLLLLFVAVPAAMATDGSPKIINPGDQYNTELDYVDLQIQVQGGAPDGYDYEFTGLPPGLIHGDYDDFYNGHIYGYPDDTAYENAPNGDGIYTVTVNYQDANGSDSITFTWTIAQGNPPVSDQYNAEGYDLGAGLNLNPDYLTNYSYDIQGLPTGLYYDADWGIIFGHIADTAYEDAPNGNGIYTVNVVESFHPDPSLLPIEMKFSFTWTVTQGSHPVSDQYNTEGDVPSLFLGNGSGSDYDVDILGLPTGLIETILDYNSIYTLGEIADTAYEDAPNGDGIYPVTVNVYVHQPFTYWYSYSFTWTIAQGSPPIITNPGDQNSAVGEAITLQVAATDPDKDALTYNATGLPADLSIDQATGVITGTITDTAYEDAPSQDGIYTVTVSADDGFNNQGSETFTWTIKKESAAVAGWVRLEGTPDGDPGIENSRKSGTEVKLTNGTGFEAVVYTDDFGRFNIANVPIGTYRLEASRAGYLKQEVVNITINTGDQIVDVDQVLLLTGDLSQNNCIELEDLALLSQAYGNHSTGVDLAADLNWDGHVDLYDLILAARNLSLQGAAN